MGLPVRFVNFPIIYSVRSLPDIIIKHSPDYTSGLPLGTRHRNRNGEEEYSDDGIYTDHPLKLVAMHANDPDGARIEDFCISEVILGGIFWLGRSQEARTRDEPLETWEVALNWERFEHKLTAKETN